MVLGAAAGLAGLTAVEPLGAAWRGLVEGRLESLELRGDLRGEAGLAGVVAAGYLGRSASCLTRLDMRCPPLARSLALPQGACRSLLQRLLMYIFQYNILILGGLEMRQ